MHTLSFLFLFGQLFGLLGSPLEAFNLPTSINYTLLTSKERMAGRTNVGSDDLFGGASYKGIAAGAYNLCIGIEFRVYTFLHLLPSPPY